MKRVQSIVLLVTIVASVRAFGASVWVKSSADAWAKWSDESAWYADQTLTTPLGRLPGSGDTLAGTSYLDLEGQAVQLAALGSASEVHVAKGTLRAGYGNSYYGGQISAFTVHDGAVLDLSLSGWIGYQQAAEGKNLWTVKSGGKLSVHSDTRVDIENLKVVVEVGGEYTFECPPTLVMSANRGTNSHKIECYGKVNLPKGVVYTGSEWGLGTPIFNLYDGGCVTVGGDIDQRSFAHMQWTLYGGTVRFTRPVNIVVDKAEIAANAEVVFEVDEGVVQDPNYFTVSSGDLVSKTGFGYIATPTNNASAWTVAEGGVAIVDPGEFVLPDELTMARGTKVALGAHGITLNSFARDEVGFAVVEGVFGLDDTVVTCEDPVLLNRIVGDVNISGSLPEEMALTAMGNKAVLTESGDAVFFVDGNWSEPANWRDGIQPKAGDKVVIAAKCTLDLDAMPSVSGIAIQKQASLAIVHDMALPPVGIAGFGTLKIGDGVTAVTVSMPTIPSGRVARTTQGEFAGLGVVEIASEAKVTVPNNAKFKNIELHVKGEIACLTNDGSLYFGYAEAGETSYFGMEVDGGKIVVNVADKGALNYHFAHPAVGGRVIVPKRILIKDATLTSLASKAHRFYFGTGSEALGQGNPADESVEVVVDNTEFYITGATSRSQRDRIWIGGGVKVSLIGGACIKGHRYALNNHGYMDNFPSIVDRGQLIVVGPSSVLLGDAYENAEGLLLNPSEEDFESVIVSNAIWQVFATSVNQKRAKVCFRGEAPTLKTFATAWYGKASSPLRGVKTFDIGDGTIVHVDSFSGDYGGAVGQKMLAENAKIAGGGSLCVDGNANLWMYGKNNTCTGTLSVASTSSREIVMYDGANWAGIVEGYNVTLKSSTTGGYTTNSFGGLHLSENANFTLNVGSDNFGDKLILGAQGFSGDGKLMIRCADNPMAATRPVLSVLKTANTLPNIVILDGEGKVCRGCRPVLVDDPADSTRQNLFLRRVGLIICIF